MEGHSDDSQDKISPSRSPHISLHGSTTSTAADDTMTTIPNRYSLIFGEVDSDNEEMDTEDKHVTNALDSNDDVDARKSSPCFRARSPERSRTNSPVLSLGSRSRDLPGSRSRSPVRSRSHSHSRSEVRSRSLSQKHSESPLPFGGSTHRDSDTDSATVDLIRESRECSLEVFDASNAIPVFRSRSSSSSISLDGTLEMDSGSKNIDREKSMRKEKSSEAETAKREVEARSPLEIDLNMEVESEEEVESISDVGESRSDVGESRSDVGESRSPSRSQEVETRTPDVEARTSEDTDTHDMRGAFQTSGLQAPKPKKKKAQDKSKVKGVRVQEVYIKECRQGDKTLQDNPVMQAKLRQYMKEAEPVLFPDGDTSYTIETSYENPANKKAGRIIWDIVGKYTCKKCGGNFNNSKALSTHSVSCITGGQLSQGGKYFCTDCSERFDSKPLLMNHVSEMHPKKTRGNFTCKYCQKVFPQRSQMFEHEKTQHDFSFHCAGCDKSFITRLQLNKHEKEAGHGAWDGLLLG